MFLQNVLIGVDQKASSAGGQIANALVGFGVDHLHHEANNVARGAKLPIAPGTVELAEQIFVEVALHILVLLANVHLVNGIEQ